MTILHLLREATGAQHRRLEALPYARAIVDETIDRAQYQWLLQKFYGFHVPAEQHLCALAAPELEQIGLSRRLKVPLLWRDLHTLGLSTTQLDNLPLCHAVPAYNTLPAALGGLYVLEGATLGGQIITRHLERSLGLTPQVGAAFFASYGAAVGPMWKAFCAALDAYAADPHTHPTIAEAACQTFAALTDWLLTDTVAYPEQMAATR
ncbi:MAG: biliverdin-producing heme oxygenase [Chloroflexaceae bacterium]|nr:biliverdin-producing heme oxygenase [Chloroflexaceae bacterium]NJO05337.1 biliverdin-producing heme oxygenase [Chloroflexaceae bacterium]